MKNSTKTVGTNVIIALALVLSVALGCGKSRNRTMKFKSVETPATITSLDTGGVCMKKINGQMVNKPQIGFSYQANGKSYSGAGCAYAPSLSVGSKINVCYNSSNPGSAEVCEK